MDLILLPLLLLAAAYSTKGAFPPSMLPFWNDGLKFTILADSYYLLSLKKLRNSWKTTSGKDREPSVISPPDCERKMASSCDFCGEIFVRVPKMFSDNNVQHHICSVCINIFYYRLQKWLTQERHRMFEESLAGGMAPNSQGNVPHSSEQGSG